MPLYVAVGGSPQSVVRAAHYNIGLRLAIIGGGPARLAPFAELYRKSRERFGFDDERYLQEVGHGALFVGSVETAAQKVAEKMKALGTDTFNLKHGQGNQEAQLQSIGLYGEKVIPMVKDMLA